MTELAYTLTIIGCVLFALLIASFILIIIMPFIHKAVIEITKYYEIREDKKRKNS